MYQQLTIFDVFPTRTRTLEEIPEEEMVKQVGNAIGVTFVRNEQLGDYRAKVGKALLCIEYDRYRCDIDGDTPEGTRFIGVTMDYLNAGSSAPVDSIPDAIAWFKHHKAKKKGGHRETKETTPLQPRRTPPADF